MFKQHIASDSPQTFAMSVSPTNQALAENLDYFMKKKGLVQTSLAEKSGIAQTTISLYLHPERRKEGKNPKAGSAKLTEVEKLADALMIEAWQLIRPMTPDQHQAYEQIEAAYKALTARVTAPGEAKTAK